jgi:hypothetical protein
MWVEVLGAPERNTMFPTLYQSALLIDETHHYLSLSLLGNPSYNRFEYTIPHRLRH